MQNFRLIVYFDIGTACIIMYCQDRLSSVFQEKGYTKILYANALDRKKTCSHATTVVVIELRFFMKKKMKMKMKKMKNMRKSYLLVLHTSCDIFIQFLACSYMFSTLMHLEDRLRLKLKVKTYVWL